MMLRLGDPVADCILLQPNGEPVRLAEFSANALVLIFLRHLA